MIKYFLLFTVLCSMWMVLSGQVTPFFLVVGAISALLTVIITRTMIQRTETGLSVYLNWHAFVYLFWLAKEIVLSALDVTKRIWQLEPAISPTIRWVTASQTNDLGRTIFANSITLTPGTVSILVKEDKIQVHALTKEGLDGLHRGQMDERVTLITAPLPKTKEGKR